MKIVFFGTPAIAANLLESLLQAGVEVVAIVTKPDQPQGRSQKLQPSAVKAMVIEKYPRLVILDPPKISTAQEAEKLKALQADLFVVAAYGEIIKKMILDIPPLGCINVHASLLPKYRGAAPMQRAIINGEKETGVTIMEMVEALDAGDILQTGTIPISDEMNAGELEELMTQAGSKALLETLTHLSEKRANKQKQDDALATYAHKIKTEECLVNWKKSARELHNLIRGVTPHPGAWCYITITSLDAFKKRIKIKKTKVVSEDFEEKVPGEVVKYDKTGWFVATGQGVLEILEVQLEGKKAVSAAEFIRGYPSSAVFTSD